MVGKLWLVGTPIGNLGDITYRALEVLSKVDVVYCEDSHITRKLLAHYGLRKPLKSFQQHNEKQQSQSILNELRTGKQVALVSDAGMPVISDPGAALGTLLRKEGFEVSIAPGVSSLTAAATLLSLSHFQFVGFLPASQKARRDLLKKLAKHETPILCFEAPHRFHDLLDDLTTLFGDEVEVGVAREMTKVYEEWGYRSARAWREDERAPRGEYVIAILPPPPSPDTEAALSLARAIHGGKSLSDSAKIAALYTGVSKQWIYDSLKREV